MSPSFLFLQCVAFTGFCFGSRNLLATMKKPLTEISGF
jgi:hypothetical protein